MRFQDLFLFLHLGRAISYGSYFYNTNTWFSGIILFFFLMATAFMGYVLPFGQMSFWGAPVNENKILTVFYLNSQRISFLSLVKNCNHKGLGIYYLLSAFIFGISGTLISVLIRIELYSSLIIQENFTRLLFV